MEELLAVDTTLPGTPAASLGNSLNRLSVVLLLQGRGVCYMC